MSTPLEIIERRRRQNFKVRAGDVATFDAKNFFGKFGFGNIFAVDFDSFAVTFQMRRSVQPDFQARRTKNFSQHCANGALAVGAGDVNCSIKILRLAERVGYFGDSFETFFNAERAQVFEIF